MVTPALGAGEAPTLPGGATPALGAGEAPALPGGGYADERLMFNV